MMRVRLRFSLCLMLWLVAPVHGDEEPSTDRGRLRQASRLAQQVEELLAHAPVDLAAAERQATRVIDLRKKVLKPPHADLAKAYQLLALVHERRAAERPRIDHLDPALELQTLALAALDLKTEGHRAVAVDSHEGRGRILRIARRPDQAWEAFATAADLLLTAKRVDPARLERLLAQALDAFAFGSPSPTATARRNGLAAAARRLLIDTPNKARAQHLLGLCLLGNPADTQPAQDALEAAAETYATGEHASKTHRAEAEVDLAYLLWMRGDVRSAIGTFSRGLKRFEAATGKPFHLGEAENDRRLWVGALQNWLPQVTKLGVPDWFFRDGLPERVLAEGRLTEAWGSWWHNGEPPRWFVAAAAKHTHSTRAVSPSGGAGLARALAFEALVVAGTGDLVTVERLLTEASAVWPTKTKHAAEQARIRFDLGVARHLRGRYTEAATALKRAVELYEQSLGIMHEESLACLAMLGVSALRAGLPQEVEAVADRLIAMARDEGDTKGWLDARINRNASKQLQRAAWIVCHGLGRLSDLRFLTERFGTRSLRDLLWAPGLLRHEGRYGEVVKQLRKPTVELLLVDIGGVGRTGIMPTLFPEAALALRLAEGLLDLGLYEEAFAAVRDADRLLGEVKPDRVRHPFYVHADLRISTVLARILLQRGLVPEARAIAARAHRLQILGPSWLRLRTAEIRGHWAVDPKRTNPPVALNSERVGWSALALSRASSTYARCLEADGEPEQALAVLSATLTSTRARLGDTHPRVGELLHASGALAFRLDRLKAAQAFEEGALAIARQAYGDAHPATAEILLSLADLALAGGTPALALERYAQVRAIAEATLFETHMAHVRVNSGTALALVRQGKAADAVAPMQTAVDLIRRRLLLECPGATQPERLALIASTHWVLANWMEVTRAAGEDGYDQVLALRGLAGRLLAADEHARRHGSTQARALHEELRAAQRRLARIANGDGGRRWQRLAWRREVAEVQATCDDLGRKLTKASRVHAQAWAQVTTTPKAVRKRLKPGEALVDIVRTGGRYTAWVLTKKHPPVRVELGAATPINQAAAAFVWAVRDADPDAAIRKTGAVAANAIWGPLAAALPEKTHTVYVVPDGALAAVPLGALPVDGGARVVAEQMLLVHLSYPHDLLPRLSPPPGPRSKGRGLLVISDVDYNMAERAPGQGPVITGRRLASLKRGIRSYGPLPETRAEAGGISKAFREGARNKGTVVHLTGAGATEANLRREVVGKALIHFATHAYTRADLDSRLDPPQGDRYNLQPGLELHANRFDPMLMSGVLLAGANVRVREGEDDGVLTALEATHLDLAAAKLVVLSACESARGIEQAAEGTIGLVRGFRMAGAQAVIGSLWPVEDGPTSNLMQAFYRRWLKRAGTPAAEALRATALAMRRGELGEAAKAPHHWAAFVVYGPLR